MSSRARWSLAVAVTACVTACRGEAPRPARERVLSHIPDDVMLVVATDGPTLATPRAQAMLDVLRPRWPERLGCAIDAAKAARDVALGITRARAAVLVLELSDAPACAALSRLPAEGAPALWVATLGSAAPAEERARSVLASPRFARALPYLASAPLGLALEVPGGTAIGTARPEPLEAWLTLEMAPWFADAAERHVRAFVERLGREPATVQLARRLEVTRDETQILAQLSELPAAEPRATDAELAVALRTISSWFASWSSSWSTSGAGAQAGSFVCPPLLSPIVRCVNGTRFEVSSLALLVPHVASIASTPVIRQGGIAGAKLTVPVPRLGLRAGDIVLGVEGRMVRHLRDLADVLLRARGRVVIAIERDGELAQLELVEP
jgi:hypothetical protein